MRGNARTRHRDFLECSTLSDERKFEGHTCALTGGKRAQRLRPHKREFQADVQLGSMCRFVPVRAPPAQCGQHAGVLSRSPGIQSKRKAARQDKTVTTGWVAGSHSPHDYASVRGQDVPTMKNVFCGNTCRASALLS